MLPKEVGQGSLKFLHNIEISLLNDRARPLQVKS